ncbi:hypothetical protein ACFYXH_21180 [Streptomyces sp. NPDC002730]|uniref:hypothetical protein n=1 Tax=Streptomyces sp. NPDC002730 TaxID=3364662 RepID=UPI003679A699
MVQAVENLTVLTTRLIESGPCPRLAGWDRVVVDVLGAEPVPGYADLLSQRVGERLEMGVLHELMQGVAPGATIRLRARLALGEVMAESHPAPGSFTVEPPS